MKNRIIYGFICVIGAIICVNLAGTKKVNAFENFVFENTISCKKVVTNNGVMKYNGRISSIDNLNVEWISTGDNKGPNEIVVEANISSDVGTYSYKVVHKYDGETTTYNGSCTIKVNGDDLGKHTFTIKADVNNKQITKKIIANVVKSTQAVADIRYRTVALKAKKILSSDRTTVNEKFPDNPNLKLLNMNFTDSALNTIDRKFPQKLKTGDSYIIEGSAVVEVFDGTGVLGTYNLGTQFNKLLSDYNWGDASIRDFESKQSLEVTYHSELAVSYSIEYKEVITGNFVDPTDNVSFTLKNYEIVTVKTQLEKYDRTYRTYYSDYMGSVSYIASLLYQSNNKIFSNTERSIKVNIMQDGVYNYDFTEKICDSLSDLKVVNQFFSSSAIVVPTEVVTQTPKPTETPTQTPTQTPKPTPYLTATPTPIVESTPVPEYWIGVSGAINYWKGQNDRFLSLEEVTFEVRSNVADRVIIRLSPELEAMQYTDEKGNKYDYKEDFFDEYVLFPNNSGVTLSEDKKANWKYYLPLADSTLDWDGNRLKDRYYAMAYFYKDNQIVGAWKTYFDITGNVYDILHVEP